MNENCYALHRNSKNHMLAFGAFLTPNEAKKSLTELEKTEATVLVVFEFDFKVKSTEKRAREANFGAFEKKHAENLTQIIGNRVFAISKTNRKAMDFSKHIEAFFTTAFQKATPARNCILFILKIN